MPLKTTPPSENGRGSAIERSICEDPASLNPAGIPLRRSPRCHRRDWTPSVLRHLTGFWIRLPSDARHRFTLRLSIESERERPSRAASSAQRSTLSAPGRASASINRYRSGHRTGEYDSRFTAMRNSRSGGDPRALMIPAPRWSQAIARCNDPRPSYRPLTDGGRWKGRRKRKSGTRYSQVVQRRKGLWIHHA